MSKKKIDLRPMGKVYNFPQYGVMDISHDEKRKLIKEHKVIDSNYYIKYKDVGHDG